ncbi:MAG: hypothetical protein WAO52_18650 [Prolixibacteraceae bacterium]
MKMNRPMSPGFAKNWIYPEIFFQQTRIEMKISISETEKKRRSANKIVSLLILFPVSGTYRFAIGKLIKKNTEPVEKNQINVSDH